MTTAQILAPSSVPVAPCTTAQRLLEIDAEAFRSCFDRRPFLIRHRIIDHPLFTLPQLIELSKRLPERSVEYNAGDVPVSLDPRATPRTGLSIQDTIRRIEECRSWLVLKNVEQDPQYGALLGQCLAEVRAHSEPLDPGMREEEGFIFISSPGSVTPYHIDIEHNFLLQVQGQKTVNLFDREDRSLLSEEEIETFFNGGHRNLEFKDEYQKKAWVYELQPGDGLHFPVVCPHWIKNGAAVSISFSITFRTPASNRRAGVYAENARLRKLGLNPVPYGQSGLRDSFKYLANRVQRRTGRLFGAAARKPQDQ